MAAQFEPNLANVRNGSKADTKVRTSALHADAEKRLQSRLERRDLRVVDGRRAGEADAQRIDGLAAAIDFVVEVRPSRQARRADIADQLAAAHETAGLGDDPAHVRV